MKNKHPYYDSSRKKATEAFALKMIVYCLLAVIILSVLIWVPTLITL